MNGQVEISDLDTQDEVVATDCFPIASHNGQDTRKVTARAILAYIMANSTEADDKVSVPSSPTATAFTVNLTTYTASVWLILTPTGTFATGAINLPPSGVAQDKQEVLVSCTQIVTALTVAAGTLGIVGAPTTLAAGGFFRMRYDGVNQTWYRVG